MKKKLIGILVMTLLIATAVLPLVHSSDEYISRGVSYDDFSNVEMKSV